MISTTLLGMKKAWELREEYRQMEYVRQLFYQIQSEIRYARSPLGDIFSYIGKSARDPYRAWLVSLGDRLGRRDGGTFDSIWKTSIRENLGACALSEKERTRLEDLGGRLGLADIEMQEKTVELYLSGLEMSMSEVRREMKMKVRLCHCLGVMSGMLIVTLLL